MAGFQRSAPASWGNQGGDFNRESNPTFSQSSPLEQEALRAVAEYADAARFNQEANSSRPRGFAQQTVRLCLLCLFLFCSSLLSPSCSFCVYTVPHRLCLQCCKLRRTSALLLPKLTLNSSFLTLSLCPTSLPIPSPAPSCCGVEESRRFP